MAAEVRESQLTAGGVRAPVLEAGPAEAEEAVVFVHGNPGSNEDWRDLVGRVGEFARAVAPDMPGFGRADKPRDVHYNAAWEAVFLAAALHGIGVRRAHLVLHDFGGPFGLAWAVGNPRSLASVTLINTGILLDYRWHVNARIWRTPLLGELFMLAAGSPRVVRASMRRENPRLPVAFIDQMAANFDRHTRRAVLQLYRSSPASSLARLGDTFRALDPPTLVIWGERDPYIGAEQADRQRESFPRAEIVKLPEAGHWPFVEEPDRVAEHLLPFLRGQLGAAV